MTKSLPVSIAAPDGDLSQSSAYLLALGVQLNSDQGYVSAYERDGAITFTASSTGLPSSTHGLSYVAIMASADTTGVLDIPAGPLPHIQAQALGLLPAASKERMADFLNRHFAAVLPALSLGALLSYAGYLAAQVDSNPSRNPTIVAWLDHSSASTTASSGPDGSSISANSDGTAPVWSGSRLATYAPAKMADLSDDQPRYDYRQAVAYAKEMGLSTNFPL